MCFHRYNREEDPRKKMEIERLIEYLYQWFADYKNEKGSTLTWKIKDIELCQKAIETHLRLQRKWEMVYPESRLSKYLALKNTSIASVGMAKESNHDEPSDFNGSTTLKIRTDRQTARYTSYSDSCVMVSPFRENVIGDVTDANHQQMASSQTSQYARRPSLSRDNHPSFHCRVVSSPPQLSFVASIAPQISLSSLNLPGYRLDIETEWLFPAKRRSSA
jgi:hypothetical protein